MREKNIKVTRVIFKINRDLFHLFTVLELERLRYRQSKNLEPLGKKKNLTRENSVNGSHEARPTKT